MTTLPSVAGTSVSGTSILAIRIVPGEVMMTADSRCRASMPCEMYMAMMPPETCAMPLVMIVISSLRVAPERNGRMVSGASVCPMKIEAATFMLSAPEMRMVLSIIHARRANDDLHHADVIQHREKCRDEDDGRQHLKGEDRAKRCVGRAQRAEEHLGASLGGTQHVLDHVACPGHRALTVVEAQHEKREEELQAQSPGHGAPADVPAIRRTEPCRAQHGEYPQYSSKSAQVNLSFLGVRPDGEACAESRAAWTAIRGNDPKACAYAITLQHFAARLRRFRV